MTANFSNRKDWLQSLEEFVADGQNTKRFSRSRLKSGLTIEEFLFNEQSFFKLFSNAHLAGDFRIVSAKKSVLNGKGKREFFSFGIFETFIYRHIARLLRIKLESQISQRVFGRVAKGTEAAIKDLKNFLDKSKDRQIWIIRRDLKDFGMSIPHDLLLSRLSTKLDLCSKDLSVIESLLKINYRTVEHVDCQSESGTPTGTQLQQFINNFYLSEIDNLMEKQAEYYIRFGDDILVGTYCHKRKEELVLKLDTEIKEAGLAINIQKSSDFEFTSYRDRGEGRSHKLSYLGREIDRAGKVLVSKIIFEKLKKDIEKQLRKTASLLMELEEHKKITVLCQTAGKLIKNQNFNSTAVCSQQLLKIQNLETIIQFERWLALKVIQFGLQKGFKQSNFRFYTITELRRLGLPNLSRWRLNK